MASVLEFYDTDFRPGRTSQKVRCLIHSDMDPSMNVDLAEGLWFCHACGEGGTALDLVMMKEGVDRNGARAFATDNGISGAGEDGDGAPVSLGYLAGRRLSGKKGPDRGRRKYRPSWRSS